MIENIELLSGINLKQPFFKNGVLIKKNLR